MILIILGSLVGFIYITTASWPLYIDLVVFGLGVLLSVPYVIMVKEDLVSSDVIKGTCITGSVVAYRVLVEE